MAKKIISLRLDPDLLEQLDEARSSTSRTSFIEEAIRATLDPDGEPPRPRPPSYLRGSSFPEVHRPSAPTVMPRPAGKGAVEPRWKSAKK